jgi:NAD(P)-dependent dehydrogenase (short-subunit alcohol dehydrogenase family)
MKLNDKIALITVGTSGIGLATAEAFRSEGATAAPAKARRRVKLQLDELRRLSDLRLAARWPDCWAQLPDFWIHHLMRCCPWRESRRRSFSHMMTVR